MGFDKAISFAIRKHGSATRKFGDKFGNIPYVVHPISVAMRLLGLGYGGDVIDAALLHDTVEDTETTLDEIESEFGFAVRHLVDEVTSDKAAIAAIDSSNAKGEYLVSTMNKMSKEAFAIKLADRWNNTLDLATGDIEFTMRYAWSTHYIMTNIRSFKTDQEQELMNSIMCNIKPFLED